MQKEWNYSSRVIQGIRISCAETGTDTKEPPIILLHGLIDSHVTWHKITPKLSKQRRILIPDLPGHGLSDRADASYTLEWYSEIIAQWLIESEIELADFVGHSLGGGISQMLLLRCPERIRRIALIASGGLGKEISFLLRLASIPYVVEHLGQPFMKIATNLICSLGDTGRTREEIRILCAMNGQKGSARVFARTVRDLMNLSGQRYTFYQRSHEIENLPPMRVFWGEEDSIIPMNHGRIFSSCVEGTTLVSFTDCGHSPHHQQPKLLAKALNEFLNPTEDDKGLVLQKRRADEGKNFTFSSEAQI